MKLSTLFSSKARAAATESSGVESGSSPLEGGRNPSARKDQFCVQVGDVEKHLVEGSIDAESRLTITIDTRSSAGQLKTSKERGTSPVEIHEGDIGVYEKLVLRIEKESGILLGSTVRVLVNGRLVQVFQLRQRRSFRDVVFQTLMPGVFIFLVAYYAFAYRPEVADFYCGRFIRIPPPAQPTPGKPHAFPGQGDKAKCIAWQNAGRDLLVS